MALVNFFHTEDLCYIHNLEDPDVILDSGFVCGRDCFTADCGISPHDFDRQEVEAIPEKEDYDITSGDNKDDDPKAEEVTSFEPRIGQVDDKTP